MSIKLDITPFENKLAKEWDDFVWSSRNGTLFTTRRFFSYHPTKKIEDASLIFKKDDKIISVLPAAIREGKAGEKVLFSHPGSNHGGIIIDKDSGIEETHAIVDGLVKYALAAGFSQIVIRNPDRIYQSGPSDEIDFSLLFHGFKVIQRDLSTVIPLRDFSAEDYFSESCIRAIRKARKSGVEVRESGDYDLFWPILTKNLELRYNVNPTHSIEEILKLKKLFPDRIRFFGAYLKGELIGGTVLFASNDRAVLAFYIAAHRDLQQYRPLNLVFDEVIKWCKNSGFHYFNFGYSTENAGTGINWGLFRFKESFGGRGIMRETSSLSLEDVLK